MSSGLVKRLKFSDAYTVNGQPVHTDFPVKIGDFVRVALDEPTPAYPAQPGELSIRYEDPWLIAVDKPAGMLVHPSSARNTDTLANYLVWYYQTSGQPSAVHPVSRLDRDTFGLVLLAKNAHVHAHMCQLSKDKILEKTYHAAVFGCPEEPEGILEAPIARLAPPSMIRTVHPEGKPAKTAYRVMEKRAGTAKLELHPLTGRTHQLRLHCAHFGFPILGDPQYGSPESRAFSRKVGLTYQQLCAVGLKFVHPMTGNLVEIRSDFDVSLDFSPVTDI